MASEIKDNETVITIPVDGETARAYASASDEDRLRMQLLLRLHLRAWIASPHRPLNEITDAIGNAAEARGMTPEILEEMLRNEGLAS